MIFLVYEQNKTIGNGHYMRCKSVQEAFENTYKIPSTLVNEHDFQYQGEEGNVYVIDFFSIEKATACISKVSPNNLIATFDYFSNQALPDFNVSVFEQFKEKRLYPNYVGLEYAIIRSEFLTQTVTTEMNKDVFVYIGGSGYASVVGEIIARFNNSNYKIKLIRNQNSEPLDALPAHVELYYHPENLIELMNNSFMAITSPGLATMELLYLNVPSVLYPLNDLHEKFTNYFIEKNLAICHFADFKGMDLDRIELVRKEGARVIDGNGIGRIADLIKKHYEEKMGSSLTVRT